jgi:DNA-directed RNA polymerase subunit RPC12/RpoP
MAEAVRCSGCHNPLSASYYNVDHELGCPRCGSAVLARVFPAYYRRAEPASPERLSDATDATCFYHAENRAAVSCDACGRFLCTLCETELGGEKLCPTCITSGLSSRKLARLENRRVLYDNVALALAAGGILMWPLTLVTAPMSLFVAIRYWRKPTSLVPRTKVRFLLAILIASLQIAGWAFLFYAIGAQRGWMRGNAI